MPEEDEEEKKWWGERETNPLDVITNVIYVIYR